MPKRQRPTTTASTPSVCTWNESSSSMASSKRQLSIRSFCFQTKKIPKTPKTPATPVSSSSRTVDTPPSVRRTNDDNSIDTPPAVVTNAKKQNQKLAQVFLDCGQRNWGQVLCPKCGLLYVPGVQEDTRQHEKLCRSISLGVHWRYNSGKLLERIKSDRIQMLKQSNNSSSLSSIFRMVADDLGMEHNRGFPKHHSVLLYLRDQRVVGVATVEPITEAFRMLNLYERESTASKAMLGIAVLWTHPRVRHQGIATRLIDAARGHLIFGMVVPKSQVAFSSPTEAGWSFGSDYSGGAPPLVYE